MLPENAIVTPGSELLLVKEGSSVAYIKSHHKLTVSMLVEGMLIPSGNDAAYVLAAAAGRVIADDESLDGVRLHHGVAAHIQHQSEAVELHLFLLKLHFFLLKLHFFLLKEMGFFFYYKVFLQKKQGGDKKSTPKGAFLCQ